ncbi:MAG: hypothetical protein M3N45_04595, partial [Actinomycetota bacterium]|nr:hypothetical protein [Actinomycetota bacterium]
GKPSEKIPPNSSNSSDARPRLLVSKRLPSLLARGKVSSFRDAIQGSEIYQPSDASCGEETNLRRFIISKRLDPLVPRIALV